MTELSVDEVYYDRNQLAQLVAKLAGRMGYAAGIAPGEDPAWPVVLVDLPLAGQISYHVPKEQLDETLPPYDGEWDGHSTPVKRERLAAFLAGREVAKAEAEADDAAPTPAADATPAGAAESGRFTLHLHARGSTVHADFRMERPGEERPVHTWALEATEGPLEGAVGTVELLKTLAADGERWMLDWQHGTVPEGVEPYARPGTVALPVSWLEAEGILEVHDPTDPTLPGMPPDEHGVLAVLDRGAVDWGAQKEDLHEFFLHGETWRGRLAFRRLGQQRAREGAGWAMADYAEAGGNADAAESHKETTPRVGGAIGGYWVTTHAQDATPYVLTEEAQTAHWLPPRGQSALPRGIRERVPESQRYWQMEDQRRAFAAREELARTLGDAAQAPDEAPAQDAPAPEEPEPAREEVQREAWTTRYVNDLPDSAFLYIAPGGQQDGEGKTEPRALRHFPVRDHHGALDAAHLRNAIARAPQADVPATVRRRVQERARALLAKLPEEKKKEKEVDRRRGILERLRGLLRAQEARPTPQRKLLTYKQADGQWRWVAITSTAFLDRDGEIISQEALEKAAQDQAPQTLGPLNFWHTRLAAGTCDFAFQEGLVRVESGLWGDDPFSARLRKAVQEDPTAWAMSIEVAVNPRTTLRDQVVNGVKVRRIFRDIEVCGRAVLPREWASNPFTSIETLGGNPDMDAKKQELLKELFGEEMAQQLISSVEELNDKQYDPTAVYKEANFPPPKAEDEDDEEEEKVPEERKETTASPAPPEPESPTPKSPAPDVLAEVMKQLNERLAGLEKQLGAALEQQAPRAALSADRPSQADEDDPVDKETSMPPAADIPAAVRGLSESIIKSFGGN